ncbi:MAG: ornithine carbamoyltransferase [Staphylococcus epidermidis]|nr:ornithine carbamoyltransferase [Staphylococcus epidermidis]
MKNIKKPFDLKGKSLLKEYDLTGEEFEGLIDFAMTLKKYKQQGTPHRYLEGKNIALLFEKTSTRTRAAFTVASIDLGAHPEFLGKNDIQLGKKESVEDTAKVLGRMFDGIEFRGFSQKTVEQLAEFSGVPVWNGLTDDWHPTQMLADYMTIKENFGYLKGINLTYVGNGRNNVAHSLMVAGAMLGVNVRICTPSSLTPRDVYFNIAKDQASNYGGSVKITDNIHTAVKDADVIYTDVWVSMGEPDEVWQERLKLLKPYQVNQALLEKTGNPNVIFEHCLPSFHNAETKIGQQIYEKYGISEMEVTDDVFESKASVVFQEAENRMHTIKAVMVATLGEF